MFIVTEYRVDLRKKLYVCAPPGWAWTPNGYVRDGTDPNKSGPEWSDRAERAYQFRSHRAAARVRNKCGDHAYVMAQE